jgi:hypothetical protein
MFQQKTEVRGEQLFSKWNVKGSFILALVISLSLPATASAQARRTSPILPPVQKLANAPAAFPVPIYNQNIISTEFIRGQAVSGKSPTITAVTRTGDDPSVPFEWYENILGRQGWSVVLPKNDSGALAQKSGRLLMLKANKDNYNLLITCIRMQRFPYTTVSVCAMENK